MSNPALQQTLETLSAEKADRLDPARFGYIQALARRAQQQITEQRESVGQALLNKAEQALALYQTDWQAARVQAQATLNDIGQLSSESQPQAEALFIQGEFKKLPPLKEQLLRQQAQQLSLKDLSELTHSINAAVQAEQHEDKQLTFDELLHQQEQASQLELIGDSVLATAGDSRGLSNGLNNGSGQLELQSMKRHREATKYHNIDQLVNRAINEGPENPGPLNPQMLAIKSLSKMRDCSEQYSRRFATYIDTLLWLEKAGAKLPAKGGK